MRWREQKNHGDERDPRQGYVVDGLRIFPEVERPLDDWKLLFVPEF